MYEKHSFLAVITARGGSKRLPGKNLRPLQGKPLIVWTIEAAFNSSFIDRVVVTSDDDVILALAKHAGAETLKRPLELAQDDSSSYSVIEHAVNQYPGYDYTILLQPTSPLRDGNDIDDAIRLVFEKQAEAVISVCEVEHSMLWSNTLPSDGNMRGFLKETVVNKSSQELDTYYRLNGAIYIALTRVLLEQQSFFLKDNIYAFYMEQNKSVDIDSLEDFLIADLFMKEFFINRAYVG